MKVKKAIKLIGMVSIVRSAQGKMSVQVDAKGPSRQVSLDEFHDELLEAIKSMAPEKKSVEKKEVADG